MHLKNPLLFGLMAILLLGGTITPVLSQSSPDSSIVINEVELNPKGSDAGIGVGGSGISSKSSEGSSGSQEYVELYNSSLEEIDISGWTLVPTSTWKKYEIPDNTIIESKSFLAFTHMNFWFKDFGDSVTLFDNSGNLIDKTPILKDQNDDASSWQRVTDGLDTDDISDWELKRMTPKSSNGKITESSEKTFTLTGQTDKTEYAIGDSIEISGTVSEQLFNKHTAYSSEIIKISIQGPNYFKNLALFPDRDLNFSTSLTIQKVLGFGSGQYDVKISYGDYSTKTTFMISESETSSSSEVEVSENLEISTDKESYIPGETVIVLADVTSSIKFGGLDYTVTNPNGVVVFEGTIFPNEKFSTVFQAGSGQIFPFSTQLFMGTVNPVYGIYEINGIFKSQDTRNSSLNTLTANSSFRLVEDEKEDVLISISTDKEYYTIDDVIKVTGRSNEFWVEAFTIEVQQTGVLTSSEIRDEKKQQFEPFRLNDMVRLNGDGTFEYEFRLLETISGQENFDHIHGDYKIQVGEHFGYASTYFKVVDDPESYIEERTPLGLKSDKSQVVLGDSISFSGKVMDYEYRGNQHSQYVEFTFHDQNGKLLMYEDSKTLSSNDYGKSPNEKMSIKAIPDSLGIYSADLVLTPIRFDYGTYTVTVAHPSEKIFESLDFEIISAQSGIVPEKETQEPLVFEICKSDRADVAEILKDLKRIGKGEIPPSMESVDCSDDHTFSVGDKLVVTGKVIPKSGINLDQSSTRTSGSTQQGSSYATNYADAIQNYVEVSIPYPKSMNIVKSSNYQTIPNEDENYTGGGGSGGGGVMSGGEDGEGSGVHGRNDGGENDPNRNTGYNAQIILNKQKLLLTDMMYKAYPDSEGNFATVFELRAGVFSSGSYAVKANYFGHYAEDVVTVVDTSLKGGLVPKIQLTLDKSEYVPGDTVKISGLIENIYYYDSVTLKITPPDVSKINCMAMDCGLGNSVKKLRVTETIDGPKFFLNYKIPESDASIGLYSVLADTHFGEVEKEFFVIKESDVIGQVSPESTEKIISKKIIEKFNRISDNKISITLGEKSSEESVLMPRVLQGSLFTSARGEESNVNLRITTNDGQCIIGQDSACLVSESTRKPGAIYSIVSIDDVNYKIRYSGNDVRLEKFSIVPEKPNSQIDVDNWNIEIIKDEQPTRFYYKVSYITLE